MNPPMRMLILLAVFGTAGSLLLAAESPPTSAPKPAATANKAEGGTQSGTQSATQSTAKTDTKEATKDKEASKDGNKESGSAPSIAEQAEAALKAAYEADPGSAPKAPKRDEEEAKDDTQTPPTDSVAKGPSPQRFVPSEQVRADFDVSFPIDI
jgi:hypothetical protein